jgi:hypothetical protein
MPACSCLSSPAWLCTFHSQPSTALRLNWCSCILHRSTALLASQPAPSYRGSFQVLRPPHTQIPQGCCAVPSRRRPDSSIGEVISLIPSYRTTRTRRPFGEDGACIVWESEIQGQEVVAGLSPGILDSFATNTFANTISTFIPTSCSTDISANALSAYLDGFRHLLADESTRAALE